MSEKDRAIRKGLESLEAVIAAAEERGSAKWKARAEQAERDWYDAKAEFDAKLKAAEERGRRRGAEERIWKRCLYPDTHPLLLPEEAPMPKCGKPLEAWGDGSWRCADGHFNSADTLLREGLGRLVREVWVVWAHDQDRPKPHHLLPWEQISEDDKEVDRRIGETLLGIRDWRVGQTAKSRALAPRDSAPARDPYVEAGVGDWAGAPRDSGKETA